MQNQIQKIQDFLNSFLDHELINDVRLPENLLDPRTEDEIKDRYSFIYHKLIGPICVTIKDTFDRELTKTETGFVAERLQVYLKEQGL